MHSASFLNSLPPSAFSPAKAKTLKNLLSLLPIWPHNLPKSILLPLPEPTTPHSSTIPSLHHMASLFDTQLGPTARAPLTRKAYSRAWNTFITFCASHSALKTAFPVSLQTLKAYVLHLLQCKYAPPTIRIHLAAIAHRHAFENVNFPFAPRHLLEIHKIIKHQPHTPRPRPLPISPNIIQQLIQSVPTSWSTLRNKTFIIIGTLCASRPSELCNIRTCHLHFGFDHHIPNGLAIYIPKRKNDQSSQGLWPRIAPGSSTASCPISLLRYYLKASRLYSPTVPHSYPCSSCPFLFPSSRNKPFLPLSPKIMSTLLKQTLTSLHIQPTSFSASSMRRGGLTTACDAGIPEDIRTLQSGHSSQANRFYETPQYQLYKFSQAFLL